jgi:tRNA-specific adenosine deaminase 2
MDKEHNIWMERTFELAEEALKCGEVPVGCLLVHDGKEIAVGKNEVNETKNATRHAEIVAIDKILKYCEENELDSKTVFRTCVLYVTVEPCIMCTGSLRQMEIPLVIYGCANERFGNKKVYMQLLHSKYINNKSLSLFVIVNKIFKVFH